MKQLIMHYIIHCLDKPNSVDKRPAHYDAHKAYLSAPPVKIVISRPLLADDNETMIGSCFLIQADNLAAAEAFNANDPFREADLWQTISVRPFLKRMDNRD